MAYTPYYTANFSNEKDQQVAISILRKDADEPDEVINFGVTDFKLIDNGDSENRYNWIVIRQMELGLWIPEGSPVTWESFIASEYDEWKIYCTIDGQPYFEGFIVPDEGEGPFQDQPYEITIRATNGLALLKNTPVTDAAGADFDGDNTLISYIAGALKKTGLELPIRIYCSYLYTNHLNKGNGLQYDMFNQTYLDHRTFLEDPTTFINCYEALEYILKNFCVLEYWNGYWQITCLADRQYVAGDWFYVDYDANGENPTGAQVVENHAQVGKDVDIYPVEESQVISSVYAVKSVRTTYDYDIFPNLLNNEGLQDLGDAIPGLSGDLLDTDDQDGDGNTTEVIGTYQGYELVGWVHKKKFFAEVDPVTQAYIKVERDLYGREISRYYVVERDASTPVDVSSLNYIRNSNTNFYVKAGDRIDVSVTGRLSSDISTTWGACNILIYKGGDPTDGNNYYFLTQFAYFSNASPLGAIGVGWAQFNGNDLDLSKWQTASQNNITIPVDGILITKLQNSQSGATEAHFKDLKITYYIFLGGSYFTAKGDYWLRTQEKNFPNKSEDEVVISDSPRRVIKGALIFKNDTVDYITTPEWYRFYQIGNPNPGDQYKHFKWLLNNGKYNHEYRRFYKIEGDFDGMNYSPENDDLNKYPIGFHKRYRFVDMNPVRDFVLVPPLTYDVIKGWIKATFIEVYKDEEDGTQPGESPEASFNYIF